jgi:hypothetical protein
MECVQLAGAFRKQSLELGFDLCVSCAFSWLLVGIFDLRTSDFLEISVPPGPHLATILSGVAQNLFCVADLNRQMCDKMRCRKAGQIRTL